MNEIIRLRGDLQARKFAKMEIEYQMQPKIKSLKEALIGTWRPIDEIDFALIFDLSKQLRDLRQKWDEIVADIGKIEKELGD